MTEETLTTEAEKPSHRWGRAEWGPFALFVGCTAFFILWQMLRRDPHASVYTVYWWDTAINGALICLPFQYALWAAWSPHPPVWRIPLGIAACVFQGITLSAKRGESDVVVGYSIFFLIYFVAFVLARVLGGWRFSVQDERLISKSITKGRQFSILYMLAWMTLCALLLALGRFVLYYSKQYDMDLDLMFPAITFHSLTWLPIVICGLFLFGRKRSVILGLLALPLGVTLSAFIHYQGMQELNALIVGLARVLPDESAFYSVGVALSMLLTALVFRYSGYRITRGSKAPA